MLDWTAALVFIVVLLIGFWLLGKRNNLPPGPGLLFQLQLLAGLQKPEDFVHMLWKKYGEIVTFQILGSPPFIFVFSHDLYREVFIQKADQFSNRPANMWLINKLTNKKGISFNPTTWKATRKFALHSMRDFGLGKHSIDERIQDEARVLVQLFRDKNQTAYDPADDIMKAVANIICSITFGKRYTHDDVEFAQVLRNLEAMFKTDFTLSILNGMPSLRHLSFMSERLSVDYFLSKMNVIKKFILGEIEKHRENYDPENMRDLVDLYIQSEKNDFQDLKGMDEEQLFYTILDLFMAGSETTANATRWIILYLMNNMRVQKKCQEEINKVVGGDMENLPDYRDRGKFPYTVAMIQETIRLKTVALGTLLHVADKTVEIGGYTIPGGTTISGINAGLMFDSKIWGEDAHDFRPERWLNEDGEVRHVPEFLPFGLGRRACPGEQLARTELFINTVALLQNFTFQAEDPDHPPKVEGTSKLTYCPYPYKVVAVPCKP